MTLNLDAGASALCGIIALCVFTLHIVSSPKRHNWMTIPEYVRGGFLGVGVLMTWRSVNFLTLANQSPVPTMGRINAEGMLALLGMTYMVLAVTVWVVTDILPERSWDRLNWVRLIMKRRPDMVPLPLSVHEIHDVARASGAQAIEPGEGSKAVVREAVRAPKRRLKEYEHG